MLSASYSTEGPLVSGHHFELGTEGLEFKDVYFLIKASFLPAKVLTSITSSMLHHSPEELGLRHLLCG